MVHDDPKLVETTIAKRPESQGVGASSQPAAVRLFLEPLEDRMLLTAWTALGPAPLPVDNLTGTTNSGRVTGIAADPSNASIIYAATAGGGIWKTTDGGKDWTSLTDSIPNTTDSIGAIAVAPSNANVLYAGTGEANNSPDSNYGEGILVSTDGGTSWTLENPNGVFTGRTVSKIVVDPTNSNIAYAALGDNGANGVHDGTGIFKTTDEGAHLDQYDDVDRHNQLLLGCRD